jgi:biopolymer transport protein ExbD
MGGAGVSFPKQEGSMSVHAPGRVVLGGLGRAKTGFARAIARALPSSAPRGDGRRRLIAGLSMTSMIDVLVVMTVFLLLTFSASAECPRRDVSKLPPAVNVGDILDAPIVDVRADSVVLNGVLVTSPGELSSFSVNGHVTRLDGLFNALKQKHETAKMLQPGKDPPTHVILAIDGDVPASVVKSVVMTAARAGYPSIDFMVNAAPKKG